MDTLVAQAAAIAVINAGFSGAVGAEVTRAWLRSGGVAWRRPALARLDRATTLALCICLIGLVVSLWIAAADMADVAWRAASPAFREMLLSTHYGHAGLAAGGALLLALLFRHRLRSRPDSHQYRPAILLPLLLFGAARVAISHAFQGGAFRIAPAVELVHLLLIAFWAGAVFVSGWLILPCIVDSEERAGPESARFLLTLSHRASMALAGILVTGVYNAFRVAGSPRQWFDGDYGYILAFKLGFVATAVVLGGLNRFYGLPAALRQAKPAKESEIRSKRGLQFVMSVLRIESVFLVLALGAAALLTSSMPPQG